VGHVLAVGGIKEKVSPLNVAGARPRRDPACGKTSTNVDEDLTPEQCLGLTPHYVKTIDESAGDRAHLGKRRTAGDAEERETVLSTQDGKSSG